MWLRLAKVSGFMGASLVLVAGGAVVGLALRQPWDWWRALWLAVGLADCAMGWVLLEAALKIGKPLPGNRELPTNLRDYQARVLVTCDVCITGEAVVFCREHRLYACLACANLHDKSGCNYDPLPMMGLVCQ
jgi:hypothetical protein